MTKIQINNQVDYWDSVAEAKEFTHPFNLDQFDMITSKSANILDYGCGYGRIMNELHNKGYQNLVGLDFSPQLISRGKRSFPFLNLKVIDQPIIPYPDKYFDAVILFAVLTCIAKDADQKKLIAEVNRVLKPGGVIYISDYLIQDNESSIARYEKYFEKYSCYGTFELSGGAVLRHHTREYLEDLTALFTKLWEQDTEVMTMNGNQATAYQYLGRNPISNSD